MKGNVKAAAALGIGYLLGRRRKLRTVTAMAAATAAGRKGVAGVAAARGAKLLLGAGVHHKAPRQVGKLIRRVA